MCRSRVEVRSNRSCLSFQSAAEQTLSRVKAILGRQLLSLRRWRNATQCATASGGWADEVSGEPRIQNSLKLRRAGVGAVLGGHASARPLGLAPARRGPRLRGSREVGYRIVGSAPAERGLRLHGSQEERWRVHRTSVNGSWGLGLLSLLGLKQPWQKMDKVQVFRSKASCVRQRGRISCARLRHPQ